MSQPTTSGSGYQRYEPQDAGVTIQFSLAAQDRLLAEVMTGFGAIPRRGAEVGGLLLGRVESGTVWVDEMALAPCEHRRGPSFLLSSRDLEQLAEEFRKASEAGPVPVGMFRSNTRDQESVTDEDRALFGQYFPAPNGVFLMVRPFATKPPVGSFLLYRDGALPDAAPDAFQFARGEPDGGMPRRRPLGEPRPRRPALAAPDDRATTELMRSPFEAAEEAVPAAAGEPFEQFVHSYRPAPELPARSRGAWMWIPLSFIFLLLGVLLGFQSALTFYPKPGSADVSALALGLNAARKGENLHIRWNREALAIRNAHGGKLDIDDGQYRKSVALDAGALQNGSVIYRTPSNNVNLRFEITVRGGAVLTEAIGWSKPKPE